MKSDIENMLLSKDRECIYLAATMIREQPTMFKDTIKKKLKEVSLFDRIKTYEDVCKELGEEIKNSPYDKIKQIEKLFNGDWKKDWKNENQYKYYPYFTVGSSGGLGFSRSTYDCSGFYGEVGFYKDKETSDFIGKTFIDIYKELM